MVTKGGPAGFPDQSKKPVAGLRFLEFRNLPLIAVIGATVTTLAIWRTRKQSRDPPIMTEPSRRQTELPEIDHPHDVAKEVDAASTQGYGRKVAEATGMMEGDRAMQGIFPTKKIVSKLSEVGLLPEHGRQAVEDKK